MPPIDAGSLGDAIAGRYLSVPSVTFRRLSWDGVAVPDDEDVQGLGTLDLRDGSGHMTYSWSTARARRTRAERGVELPAFATRLFDEPDDMRLPILAGKELAEIDPRWCLVVLDGAMDDRRPILDVLAADGTWRGTLDLFAAQRRSRLRPQVILPLRQLLPGSPWRRWFRANPARIEAEPGRVLVALESIPAEGVPTSWSGVEYRTPSATT